MDAFILMLLVSMAWILCIPTHIKIHIRSCRGNWLASEYLSLFLSPSVSPSFFIILYRVAVVVRHAYFIIFEIDTKHPCWFRNCIKNLTRYFFRFSILINWPDSPQNISVPYPTMLNSEHKCKHILQCSIQNRKAIISVLNGTLWVCEIGLLSSVRLNFVVQHDDVIKWKHFTWNWPFVWGIHRSPVNSPHKGQWRGDFMFSLIGVWINDWANNRDLGGMRRHHAHYDFSVMSRHW